jgi:hypothetical protein
VQAVGRQEAFESGAEVRGQHGRSVKGRLKNGDPLRPRKKPERFRMRNALRAPSFFAFVVSPFLNSL